MQLRATRLTAIASATKRFIATFSPSSLFANNEPGAWYDPSDMSTMFQDATGTTPVTAVEQPVGLILDKSRGLVLGSELVTNGTFDANINGWAAAGTSPVISWQSGRLQVSGGGNAWAYIGFTVEVGKLYRITLDAFGGANATRFVVGSGFNSGNYYSEVAQGIIGDRQASATFIPTQNIAYVLLASPTGASVQFDNISVRELPGNHATQTTSTSRPVLSARYNLLTKTEQFDDAAWVKTNVTVTANAAVAPDGALTADRLVTGGAMNSLKSVHQSFSAAAATYTLSIYVKDNGGIARSVELYFATIGLTATVGTIYNFDTNTLTNTSSAGPFTLVSSSRTFVGNGWNRIETTITVSSAQSIQIYAAAPYQAAQIGDYYIWGASLVPANQASLPYQRVNTATDYDADPSKFKPYLRFDGVDDWLVTPTITPGTDKAQVFAGVRKLSDAAAGLAVGISSDINNNNGAFEIQASPLNTTRDTYDFVSKGTAPTAAVSNGYTAPLTNVLTGIGDISGDSAILRVNGTQAAISTVDQGTGNFLAYPIYIGRRGGTTLPFNGNLYGLIVRFGANLPAGTIASTETWLNQRTGAY